MVNTRRSEATSAGQELPRHSMKTDEDADSSSEDESADIDASCEPSDSVPRTRSKAPRVRGLRSQFVYRDPKLRARKRISVDERHSLSVYTSRNMHESDLYNGNDSDEDLCSRVRKQSRKTHLKNVARIERRTALSLRPISGTCYADSNSETDLRRRPYRRNMSWLDDAQMHKMGYPNLNATGYSEDECRHENTRRITRRSKNSMYSHYKYENTEVLSTSKRTTRKMNKELKGLLGDDMKDSDEEDNNEEGGEGIKNEVETMDEESNDVAGKAPQNNGVGTNQEDETTKNGDEDNDGIKEDRFGRRIRRSTRTNFKPKPFENSSSSESENKKSYSLRNRAPKPPPISIIRNNHEMPRSRRRFTRRRKASSSSSSSASSSEDRRTPNKYTKNPHSKNEQKMKSGAGGSKIIPIGPETLDLKVRFNSVGGLDDHIQCLKEMVLLPMMYPEVFKKFQIQPPRGVLFHGPPGTGKTLIARALANECSQGLKKVSFFMRKGADLLSKWIGESEKQLRLLFEQAAEMQPSIIFFDELDGLAPVRSSRQDQVHASIVSTLLALMDGLDNRGEVIVIGATNRIDAIDPALRRPGRFDRELFFPLPAKIEREAILKVHVSNWATPPNDQLISYLAENAVGYCGSDLRALCSEAVIQSFRRTYPQVYGSEHRLLLNPDNVHVEKIDFLRAKSSLVPAAHRVAQGLGKKLLPILEPLLNQAIDDVFNMLTEIFPHALRPTLSKVKLSPNLRPAQLLILGENSDSGQTIHLAPAVLYRMEHIHAYNLDLATMFKETGRSPEETCLQVFNEARRNVPSVIYVPNIDDWWSLVNDTVKSILETQISHLDPNIPILLLATADSTYDNLPSEIQNIFSRYRREIFQLESLNEEIRRSFFKPLLIESCLKWVRPRRQRPSTPPPLPRAPTPPLTPLNEAQAKKLYDQEEHTMRELRIFLRDVCKKLANNKLFFMFTKPVDTEEVPDYMNIIKEPMDLETMMTKVDFHLYECARDFLKDIELIVQNALEYNPARTSADKQIRHRACSLRDYAYALIKNEMDTDFEDKCQDICSKRTARKVSVNKYLPAYIQTLDTKLNPVPTEETTEPANLTETAEAEKQKSDENISLSKLSSSISSAKKRRIPSWQRGCLKKRKKYNKKDSDNENNESKEETSRCILDESLTMDSESVNNDSLETVTSPTKPLSINCDDPIVDVSKIGSPRKLLNDLMSPSELLDNHLEFDDIDQALNEDVPSTELRPLVQCCKTELETTLEQAVNITSGFALQSLLDLYNQLERIVKKYSNTHIRNSLPEELQKELERFKSEMNAETLSDNMSPAQEYP